MKIRIIKKLAKKNGFSLIGVGKEIFAIVDANGNMEYTGGKRNLKWVIDYMRESPQNKCGNCDAYCECSLGPDPVKAENIACESFENSVLRQIIYDEL